MIRGVWIFVGAGNFFLRFRSRHIFFGLTRAENFRARALKRVYWSLSRNIFFLLGMGHDFFSLKNPSREIFFQKIHSPPDHLMVAPLYQDFTVFISVI